MTPRKPGDPAVFAAFLRDVDIDDDDVAAIQRRIAQTAAMDADDPDDPDANEESDPG